MLPPAVNQPDEWSEDRLTSLPDGETDYYEYKSSLIPFERLKKEISVAASAFWNSGGGALIAGMNDDGFLDGGIPTEVGNQRLRDWVDQVLAHVEPVGPYSIHIIERGSPTSLIKPNHVILVIVFGESVTLPHMAPDYRYYVRAGTHSLPAGHFIVEALRARRGLHKPFLRGLLRAHENKAATVQLVVLAANDATVLNVRLSFDPLPKIFANAQAEFPILIPIIDRNNPFSMDLLSPYNIEGDFGHEPIQLVLHYEDVAGRSFTDRQALDPQRSLSPVQIGNEDMYDIKRALRDMVKQMKRLNHLLANGKPDLD